MSCSPSVETDVPAWKQGGRGVSVLTPPSVVIGPSADWMGTHAGKTVCSTRSAAPHASLIWMLQMCGPPMARSRLHRAVF